jgi:hypothetical protein
MSDDQEKIIEKLKKLLRMKRGGTAAEIETALRMARDLAAKHGIDLESVDPEERARTCQMTDADALVASRVQWECKYAALVVQQFFNVSFFLRNPCYREYRLTFVGSSWELLIALHVYRFLVSHFRREWKRRRGRCRNRRAFLYGMYHGLSRKLDKQKAAEQANALVRLEGALKDRNGYIERNFGKMESEGCAPDDDAAKARLLGLIAGHETEIRPSVKAQETQPLLLSA